MCADAALARLNLSCNQLTGAKYELNHEKKYYEWVGIDFNMDGFVALCAVLSTLTDVNLSDCQLGPTITVELAKVFSGADAAIAKIDVRQNASIGAEEVRVLRSAIFAISGIGGSAADTGTGAVSAASAGRKCRTVRRPGLSWEDNSASRWHEETVCSLLGCHFDASVQRLGLQGSADVRDADVVQTMRVNAGPRPDLLIAPPLLTDIQRGTRAC